MSRYKASLYHLAISALLVGAVVSVVYWAWYPEPTFEIFNGISIIKILVGVDLVAGPLLTLLIYKHGKPGLKFDMAVIALIQLIALGYGTYRLYEERPHYMVFAIDRLEFVAKKDVDQSAIKYDQLRTKVTGRMTLVFAEPPADPIEAQKFFDSVLFEGQADLERRAEFWIPWKEGNDTIRQKIKRLDEIIPSTPEEQNNLQEAIDIYGGAHKNLGVLPIGGISEDIGMLLDRDTLEVLDVIKVNSWPAE